MIKYGLKLWSENSEKLFHAAVNLVENGEFDFLELYVVPKTFEEKTLAILKQIPIAIHATHELHGLNLAQSRKSNQEKLAEVFRFADFFNAKKIVVHPGSNGTLNTTLKHLKGIDDTRVLIENMPTRVIPSFGNTKCIGVSFEEIKQLLDLGFGFCLDFGHAVAASVTGNISYKEYIIQLLSLKPTYFHISDGNTSLEYDEHKNLGDGNIDYVWIKSQINKLPKASVVFETPKEGNCLQNDVTNKNYFLNL